MTPGVKRSMVFLGLLACLLGPVLPAQRTVDLQAASAKDSPHLDRQLELAASYLDERDVQTAALLLRQVQAGEKESGTAYFQISLLLHQKSAHQPAAAFAEAARKHSPRRVDFAFLHGSVLYALERFADTVAVLEPLSAIENAPAKLHSLLGVAQIRTGEHEKGIASLERAILSEPRVAEYRVQQAYGWFRAGDADQALTVLESARAAFRANPKLDARLRRLELELTVRALEHREVDVAEHLLTHLASFAGSSEEVHLLSANLLQLQEEDEEAILYLKNSTADFPRSSRIAFATGFSHYNLGRYNEAMDWFRLATRRDPDLSQALHYMGLSLANLGEYAEAEAFQRQAVERNPRNRFYLFHLGWVLQRIGKTQEAELQYRRALQVDANHVPAMVELGKLLTKRDQHEPAIRYFESAVQAAPDYADPYYQLNLAYRRLGDTEQAVLWLRRFQKLKVRELEHASKDHRLLMTRPVIDLSNIRGVIR